MRGSRVRSEGGFALAAVLWLLAGITVLVTSVSVSMLAVARTNRDLDARVRLLVAEQRATAALVYITLTSHTLGIGAKVGTTVMPLDGRVAFGIGASGVGPVVHLQDMQGLIGLNSSSGEDLRGLLIQCGASLPQADSLVDKLLDYTDEDSLKRNNGAEAFEYASANLPPPRNQFLLSRAELWQVADWPAFRPTWVERGCDDLVSLYAVSNVNLWTAPPRVLLALGMNPRDVESAVAERERDAQNQRLSPQLMAFRDQQPNAGLSLGRFAVRSRGTVRMTLSVAGSAVARRLVISRGSSEQVVPFVLSEQEWLPAKSTVPVGADPSGTVPSPVPLEGFVAAAAGNTQTNDVQAPRLSVRQP